MDFCRSSENASRNRYTDVLSLDQTRVMLGQGSGNSQLSDYINANFVDGFSQNKAYIATQGWAIHTVFVVAHRMDSDIRSHNRNACIVFV